MEAALSKIKALYQVTQCIATPSNLSTILQTVTNIIAKSLLADQVILYRLDIPTRQIFNFIKSGPGTDSIGPMSFDALWQGLSGWVMRNLQPANSVKGVVDVRESPKVQWMRAVDNNPPIMVVPLQYQTKIFGTITVVNRLDQPDFTEQDIEFVLTIASQIACVIQNTMFQQQIKHYNQNLPQHIKDRVAKLRLSEQRYQDILDNAHDLIQSVASDGTFNYVNKRWLQVLGYTADEVGTLRFTEIIPVAQIEDYVEILQQLRAGKTFTNKRLKLLTKTGQEIIVEANLISRFEDGYFVATQGVLRDITERVRAETEVKESEEERIRFTKHLQAAADVSQQVNASLETDILLKKIVDLIKHWFELYHVHIYLLDKVTGDLIMWAGSGEKGKKLRELGHSIPFDRERSMVAKAAREQKTMMASDVSQEKDYMSNPVLPQTRSELAVPLITQNKTLGVLDMQDEATYRFNQVDLNHFKTLAGQIVTILENSRLLQTARRQAQEIQRLYEVGQSLTRHLDLEETLQKIVKGATVVLDVPAAYLLLQDSTDANKLTLAAKTPLDDNHNEIYVKLNGQSVIARAFINQDIIADTSQNINFDIGITQQTTIQSLLAVPLLKENKSMGVLVLIETEAPRYFKQNDIDQAQSLANQAIIAITNASLFQRTVTSEIKYRTLFENATDLIWTIDLEGKFTDVNRAVERVTGVSKAELMGSHFTRFVKGDQKEEVDQALNKIFVTGQPLSGFPIKAVMADGRLLDLEVSVAPLKENNIIMGMQGIARDVTQRLQLERELFRSEKLAAVGRLAAGVAHEVNNPLAIISSTIQLMLYKWDKDNRDRVALQQVEEEIQRISRILKGLMNFARPQTKLAMPENLNDIVESFLPLLKRDLSQNNITLKLDLDLDLPLTVVAEDEIKQVLFNLVGNARDAMPEKGQLTIVTKADDQYVYLQTVDTGSGLSSTAQKRLFEPFFSTKGVSGTGLGLTIVHSIINSYGGTVTAKNNVNDGCTFTITLPIYNNL